MCQAFFVFCVLFTANHPRYRLFCVGFFFMQRRVNFLMRVNIVYIVFILIVAFVHFVVFAYVTYENNRLDSFTVACV